MTRARGLAGLLLLGAGLLLGCGSVLPTVRLRHAQTGQIAECPGKRDLPKALELLYQRGCIEDFQRQGYERVPE